MNRGGVDARSLNIELQAALNPAGEQKVLRFGWIFKIKTNTRRIGAPHETFWKECLRLANVAYLRQQVIFPGSNLHSDETIVWHSASDLKLAHAMLSGETSFEDTNEVTPLSMA